jgi:hypothetical protein
MRHGVIHHAVYKQEGHNRLAGHFPVLCEMFGVSHRVSPQNPDLPCYKCSVLSNFESV